jgi:hypothetical protein
VSDSEAPTPRASGLWAQWRDAAAEFDKRLRSWATPRSRIGPHLDSKAARTAFGLARSLEERFAEWPLRPPEDGERTRLIQALIDLQREGENLMAGLL